MDPEGLAIELESDPGSRRPADSPARAKAAAVGRPTSAAARASTTISAEAARTAPTHGPGSAIREDRSTIACMSFRPGCRGKAITAESAPTRELRRACGTANLT